MRARRSIGGAIICAVVLAAGAVVWWRLSAADGPGEAQPAQERLHYFEVPTSTWEVGSPGHDAGLSGMLRFTADDCPYVESGSGHRVWVAMPAGSRGVTVDGVRSIVDPHDLIYGAEGDEVFWGGGGHFGETKSCAQPGDGLFAVQIAPETRRIDGTTVDPEPPADLGDPPCQKPGDPPDQVDYFDESAVALRFDHELRTYTSYAATVWHAGGGLRVRIATDHADTDAARAKAERIIAALPADYRHAVKLSESTVSLDDVRAWAEDAENGLTYIPANDITGTSTDELCLSVDVWVKPHRAVRLTDQERTRYRLSGFQLVAQP